MAHTGLDLKLQRTAARVQQNELAARMGRSRATVNRYEGLAVVPDGVAYAYLRALGISRDSRDSVDPAPGEAVA
ncbi:MAG: helix-turn-helix transcriptional regulator [Propionibacteriales bacterium]|nr:helix-turn-helix transcriptional regulator [Propionibacteriales bacterium]